MRRNHHNCGFSRRAALGRSSKNIDIDPQRLQPWRSNRYHSERENKKQKRLIIYR